MLTTSDIKQLLKQYLYRNIALPYEQAYELGKFTLNSLESQDSPELFSAIAALSAANNRAVFASKYGAEQIAGLVASIIELDIAKSPSGFVAPNVPILMDCGGMGGDLTPTPNISTISAFVAASLGVDMLKHGAPSNTDKSKSGSSDFMTMLGINTMSEKKKVENSVEKAHFGYTENLDLQYSKLHASIRRIAPVVTIVDTLAPITNPSSKNLLRHRIIGVNHLLTPEIMAEAYKILNEKGVANMEKLFVVRGLILEDEDEGFDELSICKSGSEVAVLHNGIVKSIKVLPSQFGVKPVLPEQVGPPEGMSKSEFSLGILQGKLTGPGLDMTCANAGFLLYAAGKADSLEQGFALAKECLISGKAWEKVQEVKELLPI